MTRESVRLIAVAVAGIVALAGCYNKVVLNGEEFREKPELVIEGDNVIVSTHTGEKVKGRVVERSTEHLILKGGRKFPVDQIVTIEIHRLSAEKTVGFSLLIAAGAAAVIAVVIGIFYVLGHTA